MTHLRVHAVVYSALLFAAGANNYYFSRPGANQGVAVVNADTEKFIANIPVPGHSVAANARNKHVFIPGGGKGIFVVVPKG